MQETQTITISKIILETIIGDSHERLRVIGNELAKQQDNICSLLTSYHWEERGKVHAIEIDDSSIKVDKNGEGHFTVKYGTNIHYGCSDRDINSDNMMTISIKVNLQTGSTLLTGENIPDREPDNY